MTALERIVACIRGEAFDRQPWFVWAEGTSFDAAMAFSKHSPDALVVSSPDDAERLKAEFTNHGPAVLVEVISPLGIALAEGTELNEGFSEPERGFEKLGAYADKVWAKISASSHADGILYRIVGAEPSSTTPMQYGGFYLETDRKLLTQARALGLVFLFLDAGPDAYLDIVADLPCDAFAWDEEKSGITPEQVREVFQGTLACRCDPGERAIFSEKVGELSAFEIPVGVKR